MLCVPLSVYLNFMTSRVILLLEENRIKAKHIIIITNLMSLKIFLIKRKKNTVKIFMFFTIFPKVKSLYGLWCMIFKVKDKVKVINKTEKIITDIQLGLWLAALDLFLITDHVTNGSSSDFWLVKKRIVISQQFVG